MLNPLLNPAQFTFTPCMREIFCDWIGLSSQDGLYQNLIFWAHLCNCAILHGRACRMNRCYGWMGLKFSPFSRDLLSGDEWGWIISSLHQRNHGSLSAIQPHNIIVRSIQPHSAELLWTGKISAPFSHNTHSSDTPWHGHLVHIVSW